MKKRAKILLVSVSSMIGVGALSGCNKYDAKSYDVTLDFSKKIGSEVQNVKKISHFSPTWEFNGKGPGQTNTESIGLFDYLPSLQSEQFRIDLMMGNGGIGSLIGKTSNGTTPWEYNAVDEIFAGLYKNKINPMIVMCQVPEYAQQFANGQMSYPKMDKYREIIGNIASYLRGKNYANVTYETWNEPDLGTTFFGGTMAEMIDMSINQTKVIRTNDPYGSIASLGLCWPLEFISKKRTEADGTMTSWARFWKKSVAEGAMPDALSWHYYGQVGGLMEGNDDETYNWSYWLYKMRNAFNTTQDGTHLEFDEKVDLSTIQQLVTEYHPANSNDSVEDSTANVSKMFDSIKYAVDATDIAKVYWACYLSENFGVFDKYSYRKNPGFDVLWSYARLPIDRIDFKNPSDDIGLYVGADSSRAGAICYNRTEKDVVVNISMKNIGFDVDTLDAYLIDKEHYAQNTSASRPYKILSTSEDLDKKLETIKLKLKPQSGIYLEANDQTGKSEIETYRSIGTLLKKEQYYNVREDKGIYAELHNNSLTTILSMANSLTGESAVSAIIDTHNQVDSFDVSYEGWGKFVPTSESALGFKIDYQTEGGFTKSIYYTIANNGYDFALPFGSKTLANEKINIGNSVNGTYKVKLAEKAPEGWNGIIQLSYIIKDAGVGATEKIIINK